MIQEKEINKMEKIVFARKISRTGQAKVLTFTIPRYIQPFVSFGKVYKITIEEL